MAITAKELLKIAAAQIGYKEKETNSQLDNPTANAGDANWTKYARDLYSAGYYNGNKNGYEWCDVFVDWCFWQLCGKNASKAQEVQCQTGPYGAGCVFSARYFDAQGRLYNDPKPGDQAFFADYNHTGIVEAVTSTTVTIIEGNAGNAVQRNTYSRNGGRLIKYGRPKFEADTQAPAVNPVKSIDDVAKAVINGEYGNGAERKQKLAAEGYDPAVVQNRVNEMLSGKVSAGPSIDQLAKEVINGNWGNGAARKNALTAKYGAATAKAVQDRVNEMLR